MARAPRGLHVAQWECAACRLLVSFPPAPADVAARYYAREYYENEWPDADAVWEENIQQYLACELALLKRLCRSTFPAPGARAVDVGCGYGPLVALLGREGLNAQGVEASPRAVAECRARGLNVVQGAAPGLPLPARSFDLVTSTHVIEHVTDPRGFVTELAGLVAPRGILAIVTDHRWTSQYQWERWCAMVSAAIPPFHTSTDHTFVFSPAHLRRLLQDAGCLDVQGAVYAHPPAREHWHWRAYKASFRLLDRMRGWGPYQMVVGRQA